MESEWTFTHKEENSKGRVETLKDGAVMAIITYSRIDANNIIIDHTSVWQAAKGQGIGKKAVMHMVDWARENEQSILPLCPFAKSVFERNPDISDVLRK